MENEARIENEQRLAYHVEGLGYICWNKIKQAEQATVKTYADAKQYVEHDILPGFVATMSAYNVQVGRSGVKVHRSYNGYPICGSATGYTMGGMRVQGQPRSVRKTDKKVTCEKCLEKIATN